MEHLYEIEADLHAQGIGRIAGLDEAGRGPLAGPVCAAAVIFAPGTRIPGVNDSKQLTPEQREELHGEITARALAIGVGLACAEEIDTINILQATKLACRRALRQLKLLPDYLLLDALRLETVTTPQQSLIKGDARSFSIAAASIIAKVTRDRLMCRYAAEYPDYGFDQHKGYGTPFHRKALQKSGPSTLHRFSFLESWFTTGTPLLSRQCAELRRLLEACSCEADLQRTGAMIRSAQGFLPTRECEQLKRALRARCGELARVNTD